MYLCIGVLCVRTVPRMYLCICQPRCCVCRCNLCVGISTLVFCVYVQSLGCIFMVVRMVVIRLYARHESLVSGVTCKTEGS